MNRFTLRRKTNGKQRIRYSQLAFEPLEERRLLSVSDLLISTVDGSVNGQSVLRYNERSPSPVLGGVQTGVGGVGYATGLAVAPDGSYYVSSIGTGVVHFSNAGVPLGVLGADEMVAPGTPVFGPNGDLYVADFGGKVGDTTYPGAIDEFNTTTQELVGQTPLPANFTPGGFTFATDGTNNLIVGNISGGDVTEFNPDGSVYKSIIPASGDLVPYAILTLGDGDLLIANAMPVVVGDAEYCQIIDCNPTTLATSPFITLSDGPNGTTQYGDLGYPPIPTSLLLDSDGNLLVGLSPGEDGDGAVLKYNITSHALMGTIASGIVRSIRFGPGASIAFVQRPRDKHG